MLNTSKEKISFIKYSSYKQLSEQAQSIMDTIYKDNPSYWPYGLDVKSHDYVYLIKDNMTKKACGFVGWQSHVDCDTSDRIGSYTIGILPEYRNRGLAKEAVAKIVQKHGKNVDRVCSYVVKGNTASENLAKSLNIDVIFEF